MLRSVLGALSPEMAIDPGTSTTRILVAGRGVVCQEPSVVAIHEDRKGRRRLLAVGDEALQMEGRTPPDIRVVRPLAGGAISDFEVLEAMLRELMHRVQGRRLFVGPRVAIAVPHGTQDVERRALRESAEASGARHVELVGQPLAAAFGCGLPVDEAVGHMVVDVGAATTTVSVLSLGGLVYCRTIGVGGDHMDAAIVRSVRERFDLLMPRALAEEVRITLGSAMPGTPTATTLVRGRHLDTGYPRLAEIDSDGVRIALQEPIGLIAEAVLETLERTPPDLAADIAETGVVLVGGCARLAGLDRAIGDCAGLPVVVPEDPELCVVRGAAGLLGAQIEERVAV